MPLDLFLGWDLWFEKQDYKFKLNSKFDMIIRSVRLSVIPKLGGLGCERGRAFIVGIQYLQITEVELGYVAEVSYYNRRLIHSLVGTK